jgi:S1-C subfamily serine protease
VPATPAVPNTPITNANDGSLGAFSDAKPSVRHDGVVLSHVAAGGPSDAAGLMAGDVVLAINDRYIYNVDEMNAELRRHKVGEHVSIRYRRFQFTSVAVVTLGPVQ